MTIRFELFAAGPARPEDVWALVGDLHRLPEWTDAERVQVHGDRPDEAGGAVSTAQGARRVDWTVVTRERRLVELSTTLPQGRLGLGVRVLPDPLGSRVVLACAFHPATRTAGVRFRLLGAPDLRRRFDRWASSAVRVAPNAEDQPA